MKVKSTPKLESHGGGRPHRYSAYYELSESLMEAQAYLMDLRQSFTALMDGAQQQLRQAQQMIAAVTEGNRSLRVA